MSRLPPPPCTIVICAKADIQNVISQQKFDAVISIINPGRNKLWFPHKVANMRKKMEKHCDKVLQLQFWDTENECDVAGPRGHHIAAIQVFSQTLYGKKVAIHCMQGISRSPAAAIIVLCTLGYSQEDAVKYVALVRPTALPNKLMLKLHESAPKNITDEQFFIDSRESQNSTKGSNAD